MIYKIRRFSSDKDESDKLSGSDDMIKAAAIGAVIGKSLDAAISGVTEDGGKILNKSKLYRNAPASVRTTLPVIAAIGGYHAYNKFKSNKLNKDK